MGFYYSDPTAKRFDFDLLFFMADAAMGGEDGGLGRKAKSKGSDLAREGEDEVSGDLKMQKNNMELS